MTLFVSKPAHVEATQWLGGDGKELVAAFNGKVVVEHRGDFDYFCNLLAGKNGAQNWVPVTVGDWLVHLPGDLSNIWPVDDAYFQEKYRPIDEAWVHTDAIGDR